MKELMQWMQCRTFVRRATNNGPATKECRCSWSFCVLVLVLVLVLETVAWLWMPRMQSFNPAAAQWSSDG